MQSEKPGPATAHRQAIDALVCDMMATVRPPVGLVVGPWPLGHDSAGIGDDVHRALLADDWADTGMRANKLRKLVEVQVVARKRQFSDDHPGGRDLGITVADEIVGRVLLDLADDSAAIEDAAVALVDIAVHPEKQRQGIGSGVLRSLLAAAGGAGRRVQVTAVFGTPAMNWYLASGFVETGGDALYHQLERRP